MKKKIFAKTCVALDIETTDLSPEKGSIIEIAAVKFRGDKIISEYQSLINPDEKIPKVVQAITGITDKDVKNSPRLDEVKDDFIKFVGKYPIVGHNINFDINFLNKKGFKFKNNKYDTWKLAVLLVSNLDSHSLESLTSFFNIKHVESHRALDDVVASIDLFNILVEKIYELDSVILKDIINITQESNWQLLDIFNYVYSQNPKLKVKVVGSEKKKTAARKEIKKNIESIDQIFKDKQKISKSFKNFQYRSEQVKLIKAILANMEGKDNSIYSIAPGVGKELAYLAAAIYYAKNEKQNIFIAVENYKKIEDIVINQISKLSIIFPFDFNYGVLLPRTSFLCKRRLRHIKEARELNFDSMGALVKILLWEPTTQDGIFFETARLYDDKNLEDRLNCQKQYCSKEKCDFYQECYYYQALSKSKNEGVTIGSHESLFNYYLDDSNKLSINVIIDRAFRFEDSFIDYYSHKIDFKYINSVLDHLQFELSALLKKSLTGKKGSSIKVLRDRISKEIKKLDDRILLYFGILGIFLEKQDYNFGFKKILADQHIFELKGWEKVEKSSNNIILQLNKLIIEINSLIKALDAKKFIDTKYELNGIVKDIYGIANKLQRFISKEIKKDSIWIEEYFDQITLNFSPSYMKKEVLDTVINKSESLSVINTSYRGDLSDKYISSRLKTKEALRNIYIEKEKYANKKMKIIVPTNMPNPNDSNFNSISADIILDIVEKLKSGVVVSAPSRSVIKSLYENISLNLKDLKIKVNAQGVSGSKDKVYTQHINEENSVLIANHDLIIDKEFSSKSLKCLILLKFPFKMSHIPQKEGKRSDFTDKILPEAVYRYMKIYQKVAKNREDRGVFINLDNRLNTANYGDDFIKSIPDIAIEYTEIDNIVKKMCYWIK